ARGVPGVAGRVPARVRGAFSRTAATAGRRTAQPNIAQPVRVNSDVTLFPFFFLYKKANKRKKSGASHNQPEWLELGPVPAPLRATSQTGSAARRRRQRR